MNILKALLIAAIFSGATFIQSMPMNQESDFSQDADFSNTDETNTANIIAFLRGLFNHNGRIFNSPSELDQPTVEEGFQAAPHDLINVMIMPYIPFTTDPAWIQVINVATTPSATDADIINEIIATGILDSLPTETLRAIFETADLPADLRTLAGMGLITKNKKRVFALPQIPSKRSRHDDGNNGAAGSATDIFGQLTALE